MISFNINTSTSTQHQSAPRHSMRLFSGALIGLSLLFTGCTSMSGTSTQIPSNIQQQLNTQQPIISYFSKTPNEQDCGCASTVDQTYSLVPIEDGYYRTLLGRAKDGRFLVQDFYQKTKTPQSSPILIKDPMGLFSFDSQFVSGPVTLYFPNGKVSYQGTYDDNGDEIGTSKSFYSNGQLGLENSTTTENIQQKLWYPTGAKAAELVISNDGANHIIENKIWDNQGQLVESQEQQEQIIETIYNDLDEDIN
jgi:hypothetical protein